MQIHILGVCGTFMAGLAVLAKQAGHVVSGSDLNVYPPMSTQLEAQGIQLMHGYDPDHINSAVDCVIVGNVIRRGNPAMEYVLANNIPYISGPQWLAENILRDRWVLAVSGTHGKTTTTSMLTWILEVAGLNPGFLIGGVPENFGISARIGDSPFFVIEADEYDSAFFDKRSKFIHYRPKTLILNNLEFDHADIFPDLNAIKQQFHFLVRTVPGNGLIVNYAKDANLDDVLAKGCWTPTTSFAVESTDVKEQVADKNRIDNRADKINSTDETRVGDKVDKIDSIDWQAKLWRADGSKFAVMHEQNHFDIDWNLLGTHNVNNALAAIAAAQHAGVSPMLAVNALNTFQNVKRRLEICGQVNGVTIYDDFAHHPTAIATTLAGLRARIGNARMIAVLEFGSYTMRSGVHSENMQKALSTADVVVCKSPDTDDWSLSALLKQFSQPTLLCDTVESVIDNLVKQLKVNDHVVIMSNSGFGGIHQKLLKALEGVEHES